MSNVTPVLLLILDGFGHRLEGEDNAILHAQTPNWDRLRREYPYTTLDASEHAVGLPSGQFGNSEVGHLNIGAGRVVQQDISRVDLDIETGQFANNAVITEAIATAKRQGVLHIMGLLSDGGVHSHEAHIHALIQAAHTAGVPAIYVHAFLDGRDTPPRSAHTYLDRLSTVLAGCPQARLVSMVGRYWAMDRDKRWERVLPAYQLLVEGKAAYHAAEATSALDAAYARDENDEFVQATVIGEPVKMQDGDVVLFMNFRADRARQLTTALTDPAFDAFAARRVAFSYFASLTSYGEAYQHPVAYPPQKIRQTLGEYLSGLGLRQLRIAETEKYPHVTYFFNGGEEAVYEGEDRILVPSPKVATYDLQPEMNAPEVTAHIEQAIASGQYHAIICNYANGDMVGHTGVMPAAIKAVETLDQCVARCVSAMLAAGGEVLITADHGNCEQMHDHAHNQAHTQHTLNRVPCLYIGQRAAHFVGEGALRDIAPTLLAMMGLSQPAEMTGRSLLHFD